LTTLAFGRHSEDGMAEIRGVGGGLGRRGGGGARGGDARTAKVDGLYLEFKSIRQWMLSVLLTHSR